MTKNKIDEQMIDNEPVVNGAENGCDTCGSGDVTTGTDSVADESFESGDNTAQMSAENEWKDKYLRLVAEFDNYRKRTLREKMDLITSGGEDVIKSMLGVIDDIDRALASVRDAKDISAVQEGVELIHDKLVDTLRSKGVSEIDCMGRALDTDYHEAVAKLPVSEDMKGKIIDVVQKGYKLNDKIVRFAKVVVGE